jgi:ketosteroid isomerase-like protein
LPGTLLALREERQTGYRGGNIRREEGFPVDSARTVIERYVTAVTKLDWDAAADLLAPDYVEDYPQSGERIEGPNAYRRMFRDSPFQMDESGRVIQQAVDIVGSEDRWVLTPTLIPLRVEGSGDAYTTVVDATYPDGTRWFIVSLVRVRDGKITRARTFWAGDFAPADWRKPFTSIVEDRATRVRP